MYFKVFFIVIWWWDWKLVVVIRVMWFGVLDSIGLDCRGLVRVWFIFSWSLSNEIFVFCIIVLYIVVGFNYRLLLLLLVIDVCNDEFDNFGN